MGGAIVGNNIDVVRQIAERIAMGDRDGFGRVRCIQEGEFVLLNYTREAQYGGHMTPTEEACRGLVIRATDGKIMALPMGKFYNLGEPACPPLPTDEDYTITEKLDGSLVVFWHDGERWRCTTRGSFANEYITAAAGWWWYQCRHENIYKSLTVMCEVILDDDPMARAVKTRPGLYLIALRDRDSGAHNPGPWNALTWGLDRAGRVAGSIEELAARKATDTGREGWVVLYAGGLRVKIKTDWYLRMFRAIAHLTAKHIRDLMMAGPEWLAEFPDDLRPRALAIENLIHYRWRRKTDRIDEAWGEVWNIRERKEFACIVLARFPDISRWLFLKRDGKYTAEGVLRTLDLGGIIGE
jgi:hypothetical protein